MISSDYILSTLAAALIHILGLLLCAWYSLAPHASSETPPHLETTSIQLLLSHAGEQNQIPAITEQTEQQFNHEQPETTMPLPDIEISEIEPPDSPPEFTDPLPVRHTPVTLPEPVAWTPPELPDLPLNDTSPAPPPPPDTTSSQTRDDSPLHDGSTPGNSGDTPQGAESQVDSPPAPFRYIKPAYPLKARLQGREGQVELDVNVAVDGTVSTATIISSSGSPDLDQAALNATLKATFQPATRNGEPVPAMARVTILFKLRN